MRAFSMISGGSATHYELGALRYLKLVQRPPVGERLARVIHRGFHVDQRLVA
jgi:hypothetical protein